MGWLDRREGPSSKVGRWVAPKASINYFLVCPRTGPAATDALDDIKSRTFISGLSERPRLPSGPHTRAMEEPPLNRGHTYTTSQADTVLKCFTLGGNS